MAQPQFVLPPIRNTATVVAVFMVVTSIVAVVLLKQFGFSLYLIPSQVKELSLWQLATWAPIERSSGAVFWSALIIWSIGGRLEMHWGRWAFVRYLFGMTLLVGLATFGLSFLLTSLGPWLFGGGGVMASIAWVSLGLLIGRGQTNFFGMPVTGFVFASIGAGFAVLTAIFEAWQWVVPELVALGLTGLHWRFGGPTQWWERFRSGQLQRDLKKRSAHLSVVGSNKKKDEFLN